MLRRNTDYEYAKGLVEAYFTILTKGCGDRECCNIHCRSNPLAPSLSANDAALQSISLAIHSPIPICLQRPISTSLPLLEVPETNDEEEELNAPSTPRKRLTTAVQLDSVLNVSKKIPNKMRRNVASPAKKSFDARHTTK